MSARPTIRPLVLVPLVAAAIGGAFAAGVWHEREAARARDEWADARLLSTAIDSVRLNALDSLPSDELIRRAVSGMLRELHDPYAALLRPDGFERYNGSLQGAGRGLGLVLRHDGPTLRVARVTSGSPAMTAGIRAGDRILAADGVPVHEADETERRRDSTSAAANEVTLTVVRAPDGDTMQVVVQRTPWRLPAASDEGVLADSLGYVRLATISARSSDELEQAVERVLRRGAKALVLDLRGNTGGLFEEGVRAAGLFLPRGAIVSSLAGRGGADLQPYRVRHSRWTELPITVLVDGRTASAAEVIAAALRDHDRALLVGSPTYGKGLVQRIVRLSPDLALRLTTARWLTPRGVALERRTGTGAQARGGLVPDVLVDDPVRGDPYAMPKEWSESRRRLISDVADSVAMRAVRERWATRPLPAFEARVRAALDPTVPTAVRGEAARAEWLSTASRVAMVRVLDVQRDHETLLQLGARHDAVLRAGADVLVPGADVAAVAVHGSQPLASRPTARSATDR